MVNGGEADGARLEVAAGRTWDLIYMECLADEFASPVLARILTPDAPRPAGNNHQPG